MNHNDSSDIIESKTELDSHVKMAVVGKHLTILRDSGRTAKVNTFSPECNTLDNIKIVDVALKWYEPYTNELYILQINNAFYAPSM